MHLDIELDPTIGERLFAVAEQQGQSASALITQALQAWLAERSDYWPAAVANFEGVADAPRFEAFREGMPAPTEDPLA
ncbi:MULTISPECIES: ribbon-helix-helix domain-containing protein [Thiorhodovibrio]|uniref:hypothetical protein n=1 Tax=Thiorhodovibrio TaxID=61593 RepID=UPI001911565C|nr:MULTISPECIES: hypothetical protein [Thiorhodovibrio]MBK5970457.1 hypothetical protein [Thiorhodovibrio winogradskyi]WPL11419.1 hypothetical protein Thiosp_01154 [Thiorhodovibrio litoralis]